jgi:hypothetical protein
MLPVACAAQSIGSPFEGEHSEGWQRNPPGVVLTVETVHGPTQHLSDRIKFRLSFTGKKQSISTVEVTTGQNGAGTSDDLVIAAPDIATPIHC